MCSETVECLNQLISTVVSVGDSVNVLLSWLQFSVGALLGCAVGSLLFRGWD